MSLGIKVALTLHAEAIRNSNGLIISKKMKK